MAAVRWLWFCVLFVVSTLNDAFNLEPRIPIIKHGAKGSFFGFSVAAHQTIHERTSRTTESWILAGAPLDQNLQPGTSKSGALWRCPITSLPNDCDQVVTDGTRGTNNLPLFPPDNRTEIKENQWMGVTVRSQGPGKKVLVCAHRYIKRGFDYQWGRGLCYILSQDLDWSEAWDPCMGKPVDSAHEQFGYCQAGTSGMILDDDSVLIGLPGPLTWRGTLFSVNISSDYLYRDRTQYFGPLEEPTSPVDKYSYLGMSVTAGQFFGSRTSYVGGAPRANGTGQVVFFRKIREESTMEVDLVLGGEQFASSYGYEIVSADLNNDGRTDLIVGAPFYYDNGIGGAAYVYINGPGGLRPNSEFVRLTGKPESRFGFALANIGDLNQDGFTDLAIGAPFEGNGVVYIYLGSEDGFVREPTQVIPSESIPGVPPITFGYALSGGVDLDNNGYPDLVVGAFCDDRVILFRSRPIIDIVTKVEPLSALQNIDPNDRGCRKYPDRQEKCFTFSACFKLQSLEGVNTSLNLRYRIEAETFSGKKFSRVKFDDGLDDTPHIVQRELQMNSLSARNFQCEEETVFLLTSQTQDIQTPIRFKLTYELLQQAPRPVRIGRQIQDINQFPILNKQEASKIFQATFEKDCGDNDVCESDLNLEASLDLSRDVDGETVLELGSSDELRLNISVVNTGESAYEAKVFINHDPSLTFIGMQEQDSVFYCGPYGSSVVRCLLGNPFKRGSGRLVLRFNPIGVDDSSTELVFDVTANSTSFELTPQDDIRLAARVVKRAELALSGVALPEQVFYGGEVKGESAMEYLDEVGSRVVHTYEVFNAGPWKASSVNVIVHWPYQANNGQPQGKWLLYMTDLPYVEGDGECFTEPGQVNYLGLPRRPGLEEPPLEPLSQGYVGQGSGYVKSTSSSSSSSSFYNRTSSSSSSSSSSASSGTSGSISGQGGRRGEDEEEEEDGSSRIRGGISGNIAAGGRGKRKRVKVTRKKIIRKKIVSSSSGGGSSSSYSSSSSSSSSSGSGSSRSSSSSGTLRRVKRERELVIIPEAVTDRDGKTHKVVHMDCDRGTVKCFSFRCLIRNLDPNRAAYIHVRARLWNSTFVEDYPDVSWVSIRSKAELRIDSTLDILQDVTDDVAKAETLAYPDLLDRKEAEGVPIWVIVVGVLGGLLILLIIILILWKVGFFKRNRPDSTLTGNIRK